MKGESEFCQHRLRTDTTLSPTVTVGAGRWEVRLVRCAVHVGFEERGSMYTRYMDLWTFSTPTRSFQAR